MLLETSITEFHEKFYIPAIPKLAFNFPRVIILGTHHFGKKIREEFKRRGSLHNIFFQSDYAERVVSSFSH